MRCYISVVCALSVLAAVSYAAPATLDQLETEQIAINGQDQETLKKAMLDTRLKRNLSFIDFNQVAKIIERIDIPMLRKMFPKVFQIIDNVIQNVTSQAFSIIGRAVLQSGGLGGGGSTSGEGRRVSVVLPSFDDDDDEEDDDSDTNSVTSSTASTSSLQLQARFDDADVRMLDIEVNTNAELTDESSSAPFESALSSSSTTTTTTTTAKSNLAEETTIDNEIAEVTSVNPLKIFTSPAADDADRKVRTIRATDQDVSASGGNAPQPGEDLSNVEDDAERDKRYLPFGLSAGGDHGATGGSGNFLFDIIRRTADGAARAAGTVYRMVAGTDTLGFGLTASSTSTKTLAPTAASQLVAGSGATEATDEKDNGAGGVAEIDVAAKGDGYTEGIPGPITRLFVLANRGLANLVQDLILRLAQTSERIVNFKARLVTSLI